MMRGAFGRTPISTSRESLFRRTRRNTRVDPAEAAQRLAGRLELAHVDALLADAEASGMAIDGGEGLLASITTCATGRAWFGVLPQRPQPQDGLDHAPLRSSWRCRATATAGT